MLRPAEAPVAFFAATLANRYLTTKSKLMRERRSQPVSVTSTVSPGDIVRPRSLSRRTMCIKMTMLGWITTGLPVNSMG